MMNNKESDGFEEFLNSLNAACKSMAEEVFAMAEAGGIVKDDSKLDKILSMIDKLAKIKAISKNDDKSIIAPTKKAVEGLTESPKKNIQDFVLNNGST